ncbi:hypothetical protein [Peribacillus asahii]|uniref:hypothetical protein n=1 Tax=Peribacillus asahii TaxID=228899 RepID=UPI002079E211|nr:hypothetical protein [Peribacillus asahii]USK58217.1 hypothetical protein LIT37_13160 [Peribacillus asahii]
MIISKKKYILELKFILLIFGVIQSGDKLDWENSLQILNKFGRRMLQVEGVPEVYSPTHPARDKSEEVKNVQCICVVVKTKLKIAGGQELQLGTFQWSNGKSPIS